MGAFIPGGPARFEHQKAALRKIIECRGVCALLLEPGLGKTSVALDFASILALKAPPSPRDGAPEARVLVLAPKAAVDTWAKQAATWVSPQVDVWAEALGGSSEDKVQAIASRGGQPLAPRKPVSSREAAKRSRHPRGIGVSRAELVTYRSGAASAPLTAEGRSAPPEGPDVLLGAQRPRLVLLAANLDLLSSRARVGSGTMADRVLEAVKRLKPALVIVDESHRIKSASSNVSRLAARIGRIVPHRLILTGTPMPLGPLDLYGQWRFLEPTAFGPLTPGGGGQRREATLAYFTNRFAVLGGYGGHEVLGYRNLDELERIMDQNSISVRKEDALDLPPITEAEVPVVLSPAERSAYDSMKKALAADLAGGGQALAPNRLSQLMRLRQIASGFVTAEGGGITDLGTSRAAAIGGLVKDSLGGEKRIVVFSYFTREIDLIAEACAESGTTVEIITGATPSHERLAIRERFGSDDPSRIVLIAQVGTISLAVNELVTASHAVFGSLSLRRDDLVQARDRLNRLGQTKPMTFWYAVAQGTVDQTILQAHRERTDLEAAILEHLVSQ